MEIKQWTMQEDFIFPENVGVPAGAELVSVTPMFSEERTDDGVRLTGIYHIAANVLFGDGEGPTAASDSAILIEDVELEGNAGYFEYAVPLIIDLPPEAKNPLQVVTTSATNESDGQGSFSVVWDVECSYVESAAKEKAPATVVKVEEPAKTSVAEASERTAEVEVEVSTMTSHVDEAEEQVAYEEEVASASVAINDSAYVDLNDEALSFIAGLEDGISTTLFRSNDVFVKHES